MKKYLVLISFFFCNNIYSQFSVYAGNDSVYCVGLWGFSHDTVYLGGNPFVTGGTSPFKYSWSCQYKLTETLTFKASDFINDTAILNPFFIDYLLWEDKLNFILEVEDSLGNVEYDSVEVQFLTFTYSFEENKIELNQGDSIIFNGYPYIVSPFGSLRYTWIPSDYLSDPHNLAATAKPEYSITYKLFATSIFGCVSDTMPYYYITVKPTNIENIDNNQFNIIQEGKKIIVKQNCLEKGKTFIELYTLNGQLLFKDIIRDFVYEINTQNYWQKIFILKLSDQNNILFSKKLFVK